MVAPFYRAMQGILRTVGPEDAAAIAAIYNEYVLHTTYSYETEAVSVEAMRGRIEAIAADYPYYVYEQEGEIIGFCYAHPFHERAAFRYTLETTVYLKRGCTGRGLGRLLMLPLIEECRRRGYHTLLACLSDENVASEKFHESLGFRVCARMHETGYKFGRWVGLTDLELHL